MMKKLEQVLPDDFLLALIRSTITGLENKDCFFNQLHYVNRHFVDSRLEQISNIVAAGLAEIHPGIKGHDLAYVNDFMAPVNLKNAAVRPVTELNEENKYSWHIDTIDQWVGPCYNLWIPLYRKQALDKLDELSLFDVMEPENVPSMYDDTGFPKTDFLVEGATQPPDYLNIAQQFTGVDISELKNSFLYYEFNGKIGALNRNDIKASSVVKPQLGDAYLFNANQFHSTGPSMFERVGIAMKFVMKNPDLGFKEYNRFRYPPPMLGWEGLFTGCYAQFGDFTSFRQYVDFCIVGEQVALRENQDKLANICTVLRDIESDVIAGSSQDDVDDESMESGFF